MHTHLSIFTSFLVLLTLFLSQSILTVSALPDSTNGVCDVNDPIGTHQTRATGAATRFQLSATSVAAGGTLTVTLSGNIRGFVLYAANGAGIHKGILTNNANSDTCETPPAGSDIGSTIRHNNGNIKQNQRFNWKAPTQPGVYTFYALVTEAAGAAPVYRLPTASVTVQAPPPPVITQPPPVITQPPPVLTQPPPVITQPPPVITQPPPVVTQRPPVITQPPIVNPQPPVNTLPPLPELPPPTIIIVSGGPVPVNGTTSAPPTTDTGPITPSIGATRPFDAATVALHATPKTDCWTSLNNVVYDISGLFTRHPGGDSTLNGYCGKDCSAIFTTVHATAAADLAKMEANYRIGVLAVIGDTPATQTPPVADPDNGVTPSAQGGGGATTITKSGLSDNVYIGIIVGGLVIVAILVGGFIYWQKSKIKSTSVSRV